VVREGPVAAALERIRGRTRRASKDGRYAADRPLEHQQRKAAPRVKPCAASCRGARRQSRGAGSARRSGGRSREPSDSPAPCRSRSCARCSWSGACPSRQSSCCLRAARPAQNEASVGTGWCAVTSWFPTCPRSAQRADDESSSPVGREANPRFYGADRRPGHTRDVGSTPLIGATLGAGRALAPSAAGGIA
jgi:hypothetical protein